MGSRFSRPARVLRQTIVWCEGGRLTLQVVPLSALARLKKDSAASRAYALSAEYLQTPMCTNLLVVHTSWAHAVMRRLLEFLCNRTADPASYLVEATSERNPHAALLRPPSGRPNTHRQVRVRSFPGLRAWRNSNSEASGLVALCRPAPYEGQRLSLAVLGVYAVLAGCAVHRPRCGGIHRRPLLHRAARAQASLGCATEGVWEARPGTRATRGAKGPGDVDALFRFL